MNKAEFHVLTVQSTKAKPLVAAALLYDKTPRTLLWGFTCDRNSFHVYMAEDGIHKLVYSEDGQVLEHKHESQQLSPGECVPDKRLYPEACDFGLCSILQDYGISLPFTTWAGNRTTMRWYGLTLDEAQKAKRVA